MGWPCAGPKSVCKAKKRNLNWFIWLFMLLKRLPAWLTFMLTSARNPGSFSGIICIIRVCCRRHVWTLTVFLCVDPTAEENDDGEKYRRFILNARPLFVPNDKVKALVTSRLEKYRPETERWLAENGVKYEKLYMLDLPSREERIRRGAHASFKAEIYKKLKDAHLFIESNPLQAAEIRRLSGKPVICTETDEYSEHSGMENIPVRTVRSCSKTKKDAGQISVCVCPCQVVAAQAEKFIQIIITGSFCL